MQFLIFTFLIINIIGTFLVLYDPIIGSLILIFSGFITFVFPKIIKSPIIKSPPFESSLELSIINVRIGSSIIFIGGFVFFVFRVFIPSFFFNYVYMGVLHCIWGVCMWVGTFLMIMPKNLMENEKGLFTRDNKIESFVYVLIIIVGFMFALFVTHGEHVDPLYIAHILIYILFFIGFLFVICPNSIDPTTKITEFTRLFVRAFGIIYMLGAIIIYILIIFNNISIIEEYIAGIGLILLIILFYLLKW